MVKRTGYRLQVPGFRPILLGIFLLLALTCILSPAFAQPQSTNFYNVTDFGAVGDNATDNTAALTNALAAAAGGTLYFPAGTYLTGQLTVSNSVRILGASQASTTVKMNATGAYSVFSVSSSNVSFVNLTVDGTGTTGHFARGKGDAIYVAAGLSNLNFFYLTLQNASNACLEMISDSNVSIGNLTAKSCGAYQFAYFVNSGTTPSNVEIADSTFDASAASCTTSYVSLFFTVPTTGTGGLSHVSIENNTILYPGCGGSHETDGLVLDSNPSSPYIDSVTIIGNYIAQVGGGPSMGMLMELQSLTHVLVWGNQLLNAVAGIHMYGTGSSNITVGGNTINCGSNCGPPYGDALNLGVAGTTASGDTIIGRFVSGVVIGASGVTVSGETINGPEYGIMVEAGNATASYNQMSPDTSDGGTGVYFDASSSNSLFSYNQITGCYYGFQAGSSTYSGIILLGNTFDGVTHPYGKGIGTGFTVE
jgi:hypothetical protein